jgi:hypothetical protein
VCDSVSHEARHRHHDFLTGYQRTETGIRAKGSGRRHSKGTYTLERLKEQLEAR